MAVRTWPYHRQRPRQEASARGPATVEGRRGGTYIFKNLRHAVEHAGIYFIIPAWSRIYFIIVDSSSDLVLRVGLRVVLPVVMLWAEGGGETMTTMVGGESVDVVKTRDVARRYKSENILYNKSSVTGYPIGTELRYDAVGLVGIRFQIRSITRI
eukprot:SAG31_NODE_1674_length_7560_cov_2.804852_2_plen_155_part_00